MWSLELGQGGQKATLEYRLLLIHPILCHLGGYMKVKLIKMWLKDTIGFIWIHQMAGFTNVQGSRPNLLCILP